MWENRLLFVLALGVFSAKAQTTNWSDVVGIKSNFFFYKNQTNQESQITSIGPSSSFQARYGYWNFSTESFLPFYPTFYPSWLSDPEAVSISLDQFGEATLIGVVHPYIPEMLNDPHRTGRPYAPPDSSQGLGIEFLYLENTSSFSSIIVLNSYDNDWISKNDQAVVGQIQQQGTGTAITMVPEPSSLSLLLAVS